MTVYSNYVSKLIKLFKIKIKDSQSTKLVEDLNEENLMTESKYFMPFYDVLHCKKKLFLDSRDCYVFYLLHALFVPTSKKTTRDDKGRKSLIKYSIRDSQQSFVIFAESSAGVEEIIARKKGFYLILL